MSSDVSYVDMSECTRKVVPSQSTLSLRLSVGAITWSHNCSAHVSFEGVCLMDDTCSCFLNPEWCPDGAYINGAAIAATQMS
jgi:ABC-type multidrug transport system permease subunit